MKYIIWKCNNGGLWTYTKEGDIPEENMYGVPRKDYISVATFETEEENSLEVFQSTLPNYLTKYQPPTIQECLEIIANRGVDQNRKFYPTGIASQEELAVSLACQELAHNHVYREVVESTLGWLYAPAVRGIIRHLLHDWPKDE